MTINRRHLVGIVIFSCVAGAEPAWTRGLKLRFGRGVARTLGRKQYTEDVLTQDALRDCISNEAEINYISKAMDVSKSRVEIEQSEMDQLGRDLDFKQSMLNRYSQTDVDNYNSLIKQFESRRTKYSVMVDKYNLDRKDLNHTIDMFNSKCANKKYYEDDLEAINFPAQ
jgi:hypothetical protein